MILDNDKVLLGHRLGKRKTIYESAIREVKEETNLTISDLELFGACDDIKEDKWECFFLNNLAIYIA